MRGPPGGVSMDTVRWRAFRDGEVRMHLGVMMSMNFAHAAAASRPALSLATTPLSERASAAASLTPRERQCVILLAHGATDEEIASALSISHATVRFHLDGARR